MAHSFLDDIKIIISQVRILAWKNLTLKFRHFSVLLLELCIPTAIIIGLWGIKLANPPRISEPYIPNEHEYSSSFQGMYEDYGSKCWGRSLVWSCMIADDYCWLDELDSNYNNLFVQNDCMPLHIAVAPYDPTDAGAIAAVEEFINWTSVAYPATSSRPGPSNYSTFVQFASEQEFLDLLRDPLYSQDTGAIDAFSSCITFHSGAPNYEYSIRLNATVTTAWGRYDMIPTVKKYALDIQVKTGSAVPTSDQYDFENPFLSEYISQQYFTLSDAVYSFSLTSACRSSGRCSSNGLAMSRVLGGVEFPHGKVLTSGFWNSLGALFALMLIIGLMYPLANIIKSLVHEKETKMREGMLMMALTGEALWISWVIHFILLFLPLSVILTFASMSLFEYSDKVLVFLYFFCFFMASTSYCILVSNFFSKSRTASIAGNLIFFAGYFIYVGLNSANTSDRGTILIACLHPAAAFVYGTLAFTEYEDAQVGVTEYTWDVSYDYPITFKDTLTMLIVDCFVLAFASWYIGSIWPSEFGTHRPWYFIFQPSHYIASIGILYTLNDMTAPNPYSKGSETEWEYLSRLWTHKESLEFSRLKSKSSDIDQSGLEMRGVGHDHSVGVAVDGVEEVPESLAEQVSSGKCVDIRNITKQFVTPTGVKTAVDNMSLTMYSGQITALLGHNGAGKSTLVAMLTGLFAPDAGDAVIEGHSIRTEMSILRQKLGVCPQHDILFPDLTVEEHLRMFASFKGTKEEDLNDEVEKMIQSVGLTEKRHAFSKTLSGGQKRKLSVALAFIGDSKIVLLDEPTSGMDPYSRRFTWNVIRQHREGRIVILITHFMDEADLLGDRIAIMGDGKLQCCGSSLFLKRHFGVGYNMTVEKENIIEFDSNRVNNLVVNMVRDAKLLTDVGTELTFQLPFTASKQFQSLFEKIDAEQKNLGIRSYGVSVTTLEEVFIKIAKGTVNHTKAQEGKDRSSSIDVSRSNRKPAAVMDTTTGATTGPGKGTQLVSTGGGEYAIVSANDVDESPDGMVLGDEVEHIKDDDGISPPVSTVLPTEFTKIDENEKLTLFVRHVYAMILKRYLYFSRDTKTWMYQFLLPVLFVTGGVLITLLISFYVVQPELVLDMNIYNGDINPDHMPYPYSTGDTMCNIAWCSSNIPTDTQDNIMSYLDPNIGSDDITYTSFPTVAVPCTHLYNMSYDLLYRNITGTYEASVLGAISLNANFTSGTSDFPVHNLEYFVHGNYTAAHAGPLYSALYVDAVVRTYDPSFSIKTTLHPLPYTAVQEEVIDNYVFQTSMTFLLIGLSLMPASFAMNVVREREVKAKSQQMLSGVSTPAYWISTFLWDNLSYQITVVLIAILFFVVAIVKNSSIFEIAVLVLILELFGMASTGFTYIFTFWLPDAATAQIAMIFFNFIFGFALSIGGMVLRILPSTRDIYMDTMRYFFLLSPLCCVGDAVNNIALRSTWGMLELGPGQEYEVFDLEITGLSIIYLCAETVVYLSMTIGLEYVLGLPVYQAWMNKYFIKVPDASTVTKGVKDADVLIEEERIQNNRGKLEDTIVVDGVQKVYYNGQKHAVKGVSLGIPNGECFGLLGINGAGKTSLLSMLSGEFAPTTGVISLLGKDMSTHAHECRKHIGYCPQFDALFDLLTAREHLELYARLKGIEEQHIQAVVTQKITEMGLTEYQDRLAGTYSGGNKRKLSVAMAMIGEPSIVFLDEPSTGMDPAARRSMWDIIADIVTKREKCCLILTTHSMEEAEALCTRVGIMVGGVVRCLGSTQRLRTTYGKGYQIEFDITVPDVVSTSAKCASMVEKLKAIVPSQAKKGWFTTAEDESSRSMSNMLNKPITAQTVTPSAAAKGESIEDPSSSRFDPSLEHEHHLHYETILINSIPMLHSLFEAMDKKSWCDRISDTGSGADLLQMITNTGSISLKYLASWWIIEESYDKICAFLNENYGTYTLRERHTFKLRVEIAANREVITGYTRSTVHHSLSGMFGRIESNKEYLGLEGYSISQTTLEQIFNQFAAQQEEETGAVAGLA